MSALVGCENPAVSDYASAHAFSVTDDDEQSLDEACRALSTDVLSFKPADPGRCRSEPVLPKRYQQCDFIKHYMAAMAKLNPGFPHTSDFEANRRVETLLAQANTTILDTFGRDKVTEVNLGLARFIEDSIARTSLMVTVRFSKANVLAGVNGMQSSHMDVYFYPDGAAYASFVFTGPLQLGDSACTEQEHLYGRVKAAHATALVLDMLCGLSPADEAPLIGSIAP